MWQRVPLLVVLYLLTGCGAPEAIPRHRAWVTAFPGGAIEFPGPRGQGSVFRGLDEPAGWRRRLSWKLVGQSAAGDQYSYSVVDEKPGGAQAIATGSFSYEGGRRTVYSDKDFSVVVTDAPERDVQSVR